MPRRRKEKKDEDEDEIKTLEIRMVIDRSKIEVI